MKSAKRMSSVTGPFSTTKVLRASISIFSAFFLLPFTGSLVEIHFDFLLAFLIYLGICGATLNAEFWRFVPDPGAFDHIFTDQELYQKYGLTPDEIAIIESVIKERK